MSIDKRLDSIIGKPIPGGCADCNAVQTLTGSGGIYVLQIAHDDTCPALAKRERKHR